MKDAIAESSFPFFFTAECVLPGSVCEISCIVTLNDHPGILLTTLIVHNSPDNFLQKSDTYHFLSRLSFLL